MTLRQSLRTLALLTAITATPFVALAQRSTPLQNLPNATKADTQGLEVERIEVWRHGAIPGTITRAAGRFILVVVNRTGNAKEAFALDPASVGPGLIGPDPMLHLVDHATPSLHHRMAGIVDLPKGDFDLKSVSTGEVVCRLQIN